MYDLYCLQDFPTHSCATTVILSGGVVHFLLLIANVVSSGMAEGEGGEGGAERLVSPPPHHHPADTPAMLPTWSRRLTHTNRYLPLQHHAAFC